MADESKTYGMSPKQTSVTSPRLTPAAAIAWVDGQEGK